MLFTLCSPWYIGTDEAEEAAKYNKKPGDISIGTRGRGNGMKDGEDQDYIGNGAPKFEMNITNTFSWKASRLCLICNGYMVIS